MFHGLFRKKNTSDSRNGKIIKSGTNIGYREMKIPFLTGKS
jgi:hypothetical protein